MSPCVGSASKYDNMTYEALHELNGERGWGKRAAEAMKTVEQQA